VKLTGFEGEIRRDASKAEGLDTRRAEKLFGFIVPIRCKSQTTFEEGLK